MHKSLDEFYTPEQRQQESLEQTRAHHRKTREAIEAEIFEHLKEHTKKVLKEKKEKEKR